MNQPAMWLIAFVQGVFPAPIRARITAVDGDTVPWTYERWMTTWRDDIGHAFLMVGLTVRMTFECSSITDMTDLLRERNSTGTSGVFRGISIRCCVTGR